jgi:hypothetical protein
MPGWIRSGSSDSRGWVKYFTEINDYIANVRRISPSNGSPAWTWSYHKSMATNLGGWFFTMNSFKEREMAMKSVVRSIHSRHE